MKKKIFSVLICLFVLTSFIWPQSSSNQDKYTVVNVMLKRVYFTSYGLILEYASSGKVRLAYLPHKLFEEGAAVKIIDDFNPATTPQMNIIYKNSEQYKVKIYLPSITVGDTYPLIDYLSEEMKENFKKVDKLNIELTDQKTASK